MLEDLRMVDGQLLIEHAPCAAGSKTDHVSKRRRKRKGKQRHVRPPLVSTSQAMWTTSGSKAEEVAQLAAPDLRTVQPTAFEVLGS